MANVIKVRHLQATGRTHSITPHIILKNSRIYDPGVLNYDVSALNLR